MRQDPEHVGDPVALVHDGGRGGRDKAERAVHVDTLAEEPDVELAEDLRNAIARDDVIAVEAFEDTAVCLLALAGGDEPGGEGRRGRGEHERTQVASRGQEQVVRHSQVTSIVEGAPDLGKAISRVLEVSELALLERIVAAQARGEPNARHVESGMRVTEHGVDHLGTPRYARPLDHLGVSRERIEEHPLPRLARALESRKAGHTEEERKSPVGPGRVEPDRARSLRRKRTLPRPPRRAPATSARGSAARS